MMILSICRFICDEYEKIMLLHSINKVTYLSSVPLLYSFVARRGSIRKGVYDTDDLLVFIDEAKHSRPIRAAATNLPIAQCREGRLHLVFFSKSSL